MMQRRRKEEGRRGEEGRLCHQADVGSRPTSATYEPVSLTILPSLTSLQWDLSSSHQNVANTSLWGKSYTITSPLSGPSILNDTHAIFFPARSYLAELYLLFTDRILSDKSYQTEDFYLPTVGKPLRILILDLLSAVTSKHH